MEKEEGSQGNFDEFVSHTMYYQGLRTINTRFHVQGLAPLLAVSSLLLLSLLFSLALDLPH